MPRRSLSAQRTRHHPSSSIWLGVVVLLILAVAANQLGASPLAVLGFTAVQAVLLSWWVLSPQRDGSWILLVSVMTVVFVLGLLVLPWLTERERVSGPPALRGSELSAVPSNDSGEAASEELE